MLINIFLTLNVELAISVAIPLSTNLYHSLKETSLIETFEDLTPRVLIIERLWPFHLNRKKVGFNLL